MSKKRGPTAAQRARREAIVALQMGRQAAKRMRPDSELKGDLHLIRHALGNGGKPEVLAPLPTDKPKGKR